MKRYGNDVPSYRAELFTNPGGRVFASVPIAEIRLRLLRQLSQPSHDFRVLVGYVRRLADVCLQVVELGDRHVHASSAFPPGPLYKELPARVPYGVEVAHEVVVIRVARLA